MGSISRVKINQIGRSLFRTHTTEDRANQCGRLVSILEFELEDRDVSFETVYNGSISYDGESTSHSYILVPEAEFEDISEGPVIVDPTIHQFSISNVQDPTIDVQVNIEQDFSLPKRSEIGVYTPSDELYELYGV